MKKRFGAGTVLLATLAEGRNLIAAACGYIVIIGLLVGFLMPAFKTLNLQAYFAGSFSAIVGGAAPSPHAPLFAIYLALELYGSFFLLLFGGVLAYTSGASISRNVEDMTIDITLARPVSRLRLYLEKWLAMLIAATLVVAVSVATAYAGTLIFANASVHWRWFLLGNLDIAALLFVVVGLGMLTSAATGSGRAGGGIAVLVVVLWYLMQTFGSLGDRLAFLRYLGPYYYAPSSQVITSEQWSQPWRLLVPLSAGLLLGIAGLLYFQRRDITA